MDHVPPRAAGLRTPYRGPATILVIDDEEPVRTSLGRFLTSQGYEVTLAGSGAEALEILRRQKIACILLDIRMPDASGIDLVPEILDLEPQAALLMLTAVNDAASATQSMQRGAMDYLTKPVDLEDLQRAIERALRRRDTQMESEQINHWLKEEVAVRTAEMRMERAKLERISVETLEALVNALEAKDPYLRGHSARVADLSASITAEMGHSDEEVEAVRTAGRLHDIGKISIREELLNKQGPLTDAEFEHVKLHTVAGAQILAPLTHLKEVITFVRSHHERWDGKGYPDQLAGERIPFGARVIGAVEIYDALTTSRPYQERMSPDLAVDRMRDLVNTAIDPDVVEALARVVARREALVFLDEGTGARGESERDAGA